MSKKVTITSEIQASIRHSLGDPDFDTSLVSVFEGRFISTEPVKKRGLWDGARISASTLMQMSEFLDKEGNALPLHVMHETQLLPVGKVFKAKTMILPNGETELRGQFYVANTETDYINKIEAATIDEVSIGLATEHLFCSECDFDYLGPDADLMNILSCTCGNDHTVGENGVHVRPVGLKSWNELSLVGTGAANKAKILGQSKQRLSQDVVDRLAANKNWEAALMQTSCKLNEGETTMSIDATLYAKAVEEKATVSAELKLANEKVADVQTKLDAANTALTAAQAEIAELKKDDTKAELSKVQAEVAAATEKLKVHAKAALVASGTPDAEVPEGLVAMLSMIEEKGLKLHQAVGAGEGTSKENKNDVDKLEAAVDYRKQSFKLSK